jgi:hypothetical protein
MINSESVLRIACSPLAQKSAEKKKKEIGVSKVLENSDNNHSMFK